jgi:tight adherence protein B
MILAYCFLLVFALIMAIAVFGFLYRQQHRQKVVKDMLQTVAGTRPMPVTKLLKDITPETKGFQKMLKSLNLAEHLQSSIKQAGLTWTPSTLFMATVGAAVPGFLLGLRFPFIINEVLTCLVLAGGTASLPYMYVRTKRRKRLAALEEQFPEALDFMARSVRAGHAFMISLSMVGEHVPEPLSTELRTVFNEVNLGAPLGTALENLTIRVPLLDFKFFTSTVMLQRQTGGQPQRNSGPPGARHPGALPVERRSESRQRARQVDGRNSDPSAAPHGTGPAGRGARVSAGHGEGPGWEIHDRGRRRRGTAGKLLHPAHHQD